MVSRRDPVFRDEVIKMPLGVFRAWHELYPSCVGMLMTDFWTMDNDEGDCLAEQPRFVFLWRSKLEVSFKHTDGFKGQMQLPIKFCRLSPRDS